jgi:hypothetical protein
MGKKPRDNFHKGAVVKPFHIPGQRPAQAIRRLINSNPHIFRPTYDYTTPSVGYVLSIPTQNYQTPPDCIQIEYEIPMPTPCLHKSGLVEVTIRGERYYTCPTIDCTIYSKDQEFVQNHVDRIKPDAANPVYCRPLKEEGNRYRQRGSSGDYVPAPNQHKEYDDAVECVKSKQQMNKCLF